MEAATSCPHPSCRPHGGEPELAWGPVTHSAGGAWPSLASVLPLPSGLNMCQLPYSWREEEEEEEAMGRWSGESGVWAEATSASQAGATALSPPPSSLPSRCLAIVLGVLDRMHGG